MILSTKDLMFKEWLVKKSIKWFIRSYTIEEIIFVKTTIIKVKSLYFKF